MKESEPMKNKQPLILLAILIVLVGVMISSGRFGLRWEKLWPQGNGLSLPKEETIKIVSEESVVIDVVEKVSPSVVTVNVTKTQSVGNIFKFDHLYPFSFFRQPRQPVTEEKVEQDLGTGFIISSNGLIATNKHVVADTSGQYKIITQDDKTYEVAKIYRDPVNDLAILKIEAKGLKPVEMGDSSRLKVGQFVIAIGTPLGFRNSVTTGVVSGLGRGITAGSPFEGYVERLDDVIQTDAAISPGNSGGPLLNSSGQVIGINVAVSGQGQNIGFAIPINVIKDSLDNFNKTGKFSRPFLGIRYNLINRNQALANDVPEGAYVQEVVSGSPAERAGLKVGDIVIKVDDLRISENNQDLTNVIAGKKVGQTVELTVWRDGKEIKISVLLGETS
jgi:S1-C subfamily serine protease